MYLCLSDVQFEQTDKGLLFRRKILRKVELVELQIGLVIEDLPLKQLK